MENYILVKIFNKNSPLLSNLPSFTTGAFLSLNANISLFLGV